MYFFAKKLESVFWKVAGICCCFLFAFSSSTYAQVKYEREYRIKANDAPKVAQAFVNQCCEGHKVKWYAEESQDGHSFEAKVRIDKHLYSIEFDTTGKIEDVEKTVKYKTLDWEAQHTISKSLEGLFKKYSILKIQIQWKGLDQGLISLITSGKSEFPFQLAYEIEVRPKGRAYSHPREVLLSPTGEVLKQLKIIGRNTDNLDY